MNKNFSFEKLVIFSSNLIAQAHCGGIEPLPEREVQIQRLLQVLMRRHILLVGAKDVNTSYLIKGLAYQLAYHSSPKFSKAEVVWLNHRDFIEYGKNKGSIRALVRDKGKPFIIGIEQIEELVQTAECTNQTENLYKLSNLKGVRLIGTTKLEGYYFGLREIVPELIADFKVMKIGKLKRGKI